MRRIIFFILCWFLLGTSVAQSAVSTLLADTKTGVIMSSRNSKVQQYPASLTKVMTLYLTFNALENGLLKMDDALPISLHAAKQPASKLYLKAGDTIRVKDAINALIIKSANDVAVVLAESLAPSEADFAKMMTETAKQLGMKNTVFRNASGLHHPSQVTTAQDMAILTIALINHFPKYYKMFDRNEFTYRGKVYKSHNRVTQKYKGAEGLKTGYVAAVGYNIISTAKRGNQRLVSVVIGQKTSATRDRQAINLLDKGFSMAKNQKSVLQKLKRNGETLNTRSVATRPNLKRQLKTMEKRLAQVKKVSGKVQSTQLAKVTKSGKLNQLSLPDAAIALDEIEQGDQDDTTAKAADTPVQAPDILSDTLIAKVDADQEKSTKANNNKEEKIASNQNNNEPRTFSADQPVLAQTKVIVSPKDSTVAYQAMPVGLQPFKSENTTVANKETPTAKPEAEVAPMVAQNENSKIPAKEPETKEIATLESTTTETIIAEQAKSESNATISETIQPSETKPAKLILAKKSDTMQMRKASWGIQVGAFSSKSAAQKQADKAFRYVRGADKFIKITQTDQFYRSRIYGFKTKKAANLACRRLKSNKINCLPLSPTLQSMR